MIVFFIFQFALQDGFFNDDGLFIHVILELFAAKSLQDLVLYMLSRLSMRTVDSYCLAMPPVYRLYESEKTGLLSCAWLS